MRLKPVLPEAGLVPVLSFIAAITVFLSLGLGKYPLPPEKVLAVLFDPAGSAQNQAIEHQVIWTIRIPRVLTALCAGAALALCGAALQGVFHNPLVDPHVIGVTSGAAFGGTLAILLSASPLVMMLSSFGFGLAALFLVYMISRMVSGGTNGLGENNLILVLTGVILSGFFSALVSMLQYLADTESKLPVIVFWLMGSFATSNWNKLFMFAVPFVIASFILIRLRWRINVLSMGDKDAKSLGMKVGGTKWLILVMCAMLVSAQVAVSGSIGWIGLVIPHLARLIAGVDHRRLLPSAFLLGGTFMILVDDLARMLASDEIPLGIITAIFGAPLFTILLAKTMRNKS
jgi:iron complex transport system permease protein